MAHSIVFFGSFGNYSAMVLRALLKADLLKVTQVVTAPPFTNRRGRIEKSPVQEVAEENQLPVLTKMPLSFAEIRPDFKADFLITAGYGQLLPTSLLSQPRIAALNLHFSLLPKYRGANPGEWALLFGEKETGISIIEMNEDFDQGGVVFSTALAIAATENRETLYKKLYQLGGKHLPTVIDQFAQGLLKPQPQPATNLPYASRFQRNDGLIAWAGLSKLLTEEKTDLNYASPKLQQVAQLQGLTDLTARYVARAVRALYHFPAVWTIVPTTKGEKRLKIHQVSLQDGRLILERVQLEGQNEATWNQVKNSIKKRK